MDLEDYLFIPLKIFNFLNHNNLYMYGMPYDTMAASESQKNGTDSNAAGVMRIADLFTKGKNEITLNVEGIGESYTQSGFECFYLFTADHPVLVYKNNRIGHVLEENFFKLEGAMFDITITIDQGKNGFTFYNVTKIRKTGDAILKAVQTKIEGF